MVSVLVKTIGNVLFVDIKSVYLINNLFEIKMSIMKMLVLKKLLI